jgi:hypothetical protein
MYSCLIRQPHYHIGAAATTDALKQITPTSAEGSAVKAVFLIGNPQHKPGKQSNTDQNGGSSTDNSRGISSSLPGAGIPDAWDQSSKVLDVCYTVSTVLSISNHNNPLTQSITG